MKIKDTCDVEELKIILNKMCYINDYGEWCFESNKDTEDLAQAISNLDVKLTLDEEILSQILQNFLAGNIRTVQDCIQLLKSKAGEIIVREK